MLTAHINAVEDHLLAISKIPANPGHSLHKGTVDCVNRPETLGGDFCMLHNPNASLGVDQSLFSWCEQLSLVGDKLITRKPN